MVCPARNRLWFALSGHTWHFWAVRSLPSWILLPEMSSCRPGSFLSFKSLLLSHLFRGHPHLPTLMNSLSHCLFFTISVPTGLSVTLIMAYNCLFMGCWPLSLLSLRLPAKAGTESNLPAWPRCLIHIAGVNTDITLKHIYLCFYLAVQGLNSGIQNL